VLWPGGDFTPGFYVTGISVGTAGTVEILTAAGDDVTIPANCLATGVQHTMNFKTLKAATGASQIVIWGHEVR
jgi:hypothetical protein